MKYYGLYIGSGRIHLIDPRGKIVIDEPNIAIKNNTNKLIWGERVFELSRNSAKPVNIIYPFKNDVISDFNTTVLVLQDLLSLIHLVWLKKPAVIVSFCAKASHAEKQALEQALSIAGFGHIILVPKSILALLGSQQSLNKPTTLSLVELGAASSEFLLTCYGDILALDSLSSLSREVLVDSIHKYLRKKYQITANNSLILNLIDTTDALHQNPKKQHAIQNKNGKLLLVSSLELRPLFSDMIDPLVKNILSRLADAPCQATTDIAKNTILLSGDLSTIRFIDRYLTYIVGLKFARVSPSSSLAGIKFIQQHVEYYETSLLHRNITTLFTQ